MRDPIPPAPTAAVRRLLRGGGFSLLMTTPPLSDGRTPGAPAREPSDRRSLVLLIGAFVVVVLGFAGSTLYGEMRASEIDQEIAGTRANALPSVEGVVGAQTALRHLGEAAEEYRDAAGEQRRSAWLAIDEARRRFDAELAEEQATNMYPGEREAAAAVMSSLLGLDAILARMRADPGPAGGDGAGPAVSGHDLSAAVERLGADLDALLEINARNGRVAVGRVVSIREGSMRIAFGLDALCMLFSILAATVAVRALRSQRALERAHGKMLEVRADELEMFARRIAHDLLGPLSALSFTLSSVRRNSERKTPIEEPLTRAFSCLKRSQRLVDGVLDFARSGAAPPGGGRASLREVVDGVVEEVRTEANGAVEIEIVPWRGTSSSPARRGSSGACCRT